MTLSTLNPKPDAEKASASPSRQPWWRGATIYQIYPRSFLDSNGDGIGDLPGILSRLDHVAALGVDAVWISPFFTSPMKDFGYDVADYRGIDPIFGTMDDFDRLVARAHALGLKLVIDQVYSHTSDMHAWFAESRASRANDKADWYVWADPRPDGSPPNNWQSVFGGPAWTWDSRRSQYYFHNFLTSQPDLNVHNPLVQDALLDVARFWLDRGVDGFRLDAINFAMHDPALRDNPPAGLNGPGARTFDYQVHKYNQSHPDIVTFLERLRAVTDAYPDRFTLAEIGGPDALGEMQRFTRGETRLNSAYSFDYLYADRIGPDHVRRTSLNWPDDVREGWPSWAFSNHDAPRCVSRWHDGSDPAAYSKLMALLLLTLRGNAIVYQGEELGLPQADIPFDRLQDPEAKANWPKTLGRDGARTPMPWTAGEANCGFSSADPWLPVDKRHVPLAVDIQSGDPSSVLAFYKAMIAIRSRTECLRSGSITFLDAPDPIVAFVRAAPGQRWLVAANLGAGALDWKPSSLSGTVRLDTLGTRSRDGEPSGLPGRLDGFAGYAAELE